MSSVDSNPTTGSKAPTEEAVNMYVNEVDDNVDGDDAVMDGSDTNDDGTEYTYEYSDHGSDHDSSIAQLQDGAEQGKDDDDIDDDDLSLLSNDDDKKISDTDTQLQGDVKIAADAVSEASSWSMVKSVQKRVMGLDIADGFIAVDDDAAAADSAAAAKKKHKPTNEVHIDTSGLEKKDYSRDQNDQMSWSMVSDNASIKTMSTMGTVAGVHHHNGDKGSTKYGLVASVPQFDLEGVELDLRQRLGQGNDVKEDMTVSIGSTIFQNGCRICRVCTLMNKPSATVCEACGFPLTANPMMDADHQLAVRLAQEENNQAQKLDAALAESNGFLSFGFAGFNFDLSLLSSTTAADLLPLDRAHQLVAKLRTIVLNDDMKAIDDGGLSIVNVGGEGTGVEPVLRAERFLQRAFQLHCADSTTSENGNSNSNNDIDAPTSSRVVLGYHFFPMNPNANGTPNDLLKNRMSGWWRNKFVGFRECPFANEGLFEMSNSMVCLSALLPGKIGGALSKDETADSFLEPEQDLPLRVRNQDGFELPLVFFKSRPLSVVDPENPANRAARHIHSRSLDVLSSFFGGVRFLASDPKNWVPPLLADPSESSNDDAVVCPQPRSPIPVRLSAKCDLSLETPSTKGFQSYFTRPELGATSILKDTIPKGPNSDIECFVTDDLVTQTRNGTLSRYNVEGVVHIKKSTLTNVQVDVKLVKHRPWTIVGNADVCTLDGTSLSASKKLRDANDTLDWKTDIPAKRNKWVPIMMYRSGDLDKAERASLVLPVVSS